MYLSIIIYLSIYLSILMSGALAPLSLSLSYQDIATIPSGEPPNPRILVVGDIPSGISMASSTEITSVSQPAWTIS